MLYSKIFNTVKKINKIQTSLSFLLSKIFKKFVMYMIRIIDTFHRNKLPESVSKFTNAENINK